MVSEPTFKRRNAHSAYMSIFKQGVASTKIKSEVKLVYSRSVMKKTNGKSILIFLLALAWLGLIVFIYINESKTSETFAVIQDVDYSIDPYTDEELKALAEKMNSPELEVIITPHGDFLFETQDEIESKIQDDYLFIIDPEIETEVESESFIFPVEPLVSQVVIQPVITRARCGDFFCYSSLEFLELYDDFEKNQNLDFLGKYIYNLGNVDQYIKEKAENRGYQQRGFANESDLIWFENVQTRPEVKDAYITLRNEMLQEGIRLHLVSGYRSSTSQRFIFKDKIGVINQSEIPTGIHDQKLDEVLSRSAIPGYSKHHSGYAVDFGCGNDYLVYSFAETECFDWMSANNFENSKKHGFIPSYPDNVESQGPNPEPWEFVWVGVQNLK